MQKKLFSNYIKNNQFGEIILKGDCEVKSLILTCTFDFGHITPLKC